jgi:glycine dehydrogenase subunit 1
MPYIPHTAQDTNTMLNEIGIKTVADLFSEIPAKIRIDGFKTIPEGMTEHQAARLFQQRAQQDRVQLNFIGAGAYEHYIPAVVWDITSRGEFLTAYTPYQAEASQGTLQLLYEYQTMMANLMAMDVSNTSLYEGASALAEAILMAVRLDKKAEQKNILVAGTLNPNYVRVVNTIVKNQGIKLHTVPFDPVTGIIDVATLEQFSQQEITALVIAQPNFFGALENVDMLTDWAHEHDILVIGVVNPLAMALLKPPGEWGASAAHRGVDLACGELQPFGIPLASGGPYAGFLCCKQDYVRQLPGRLIGCTVDLEGKRGFSLTLQAREQHIRRGKATSNICTNQGLLVTAATIYMSLMGAEGLRRIAATCHANTEALLQQLTKLPGVKKVFSAPFFHEMVIQFEQPVEKILEALSRQGILAGFNVSQAFPDLKNCLLLCVTETKTAEDIDQFVTAIKAAMNIAMEAIGAAK